MSAAMDAMYESLDSFFPKVADLRTKEQKYREAFDEAMRGDGDFWPTDGWKTPKAHPKYDGEQYIGIFVAVQYAMRGWMSDADFRKLIEAAVRQEVSAYAEQVSK